ncbi:hypothetical protein Emed_000779 [Eimeria media]
MEPHMNGKPSLQAPIRAGTLNVLRDHVVWGTPILPGAAFLDAMLAAGLARSKATLADGCAELHDAAILQPMILCEGPEVWGTNNPRCATSHTSLGLTLEVDDSRDRTFVKVSSSHVGGISAEATLSTGTTHAEAFVSFVDESSPRKPQRVDIKAAQEHILQAKGVQLGCAEVYQELGSRGLEYGPCFQTIRSLLIGENTALVELQFQHKVADFESSFILHPSILDGCIQAAVILASRHMPESARTLIPTNASDMRVWNTTRSDQRYWAHIKLVQGAQMTTQGGGAVVSMTLVDDCANVMAEVGTLRLGEVKEDQVFPPERDLGRGMLWSLRWRELKGEPSAPQTAVAGGANSQLAWCLYGVPKDLTNSLENEVHLAENTNVALHFSDSTPHDESTGADSLAKFNALIHFGGLYQNDDSAVEYLADVLSFLQRVAKQLANDTNSTIPPIIVAARRLSAIVPGDDETCPLLAGVRGLCRTAKLEMEAQANRHVPLFLVDLDVAQQLNSADFPTDVLDQLAGVLRLPALREAIQNATKSEQRLIEIELAIRSGHTYVPRLKYSGIQLNHSMRRGIELEKGKTFVVTGGLGGLGLVVAEWLAENGAGSVVLLSRTGTPPKEGRTAQLWQALRERHCATDFIIQKCDVGLPNDVENLFAGLKKGVLICHHTCCPYFVKTLSGIFHCAGVLDDRPLLQQDHLALERVFEPKANYAAANCCLDELAALRRRRHLVAHSIQWGPWVEQGMAAELQGRLAKAGFGGISNALGMLTLSAVMQQDAECVVGCQPVYWERFLGRYKFAPPRTFEEYVQLAAAKAKASAAASAVRKTRPRTEAKQRGGKPEHKDQKKQIQHVVVSAAKSVLNDSADVLVDAPLQELGIDSLGAIEFRDAIQAALNVRLSATVLFDHPSIEALTNFLLTEVGDTEPAEAASVIDEAPLMEDVSGFGTAVVGMACRFPGSSNDPRSFWGMVSAGTDCIHHVPLSRFDVEAAYSSDLSAEGKVYTRLGGAVERIDLFDHQCFSISSSEARQMDPRQRMSLEIACEALLDAGIDKGTEGRESTGVFVGAMNHETALNGGPQTTAYTVTAAHMSILSNRISYVNGFYGPSVTIDTACSSSLVALDFSLGYLLSQAIFQALIVGVNLMLRVEAFQQTCKAHMLSVDGRCKTFDASANGYVRSEGCGAVILKALPRDTTDSSTVYAWIRGAANNHVGRSASLTAPNGPAQQAVIRAALHNAGINSPAEVSVLEAHGTGTSLGDPIEVGAIRAVYCNGFPHSPPLILGALKSLMGHAEGAAGIAGLIKLMLVLQHRTATPNLHLNTLNPHIDLDKGDRYRDILFPSKCVPLGSLFGMTDSQPLLGAVSSFGFGGSNAHAIVEVPPIFKPTWTINGNQAAADLAEANATVIWLFSGQGSQYLDMACAYFRHSPIFKDTIAACTATLKQMSWFPTDGPQSIEDLVYGTEWQPDAQAREEILSSTQYSQVAIFAVELALSKVLMGRGLKPDIVLGHSLGEYAAATIAGVMEWEDALRLVAKRASLLAAQPQQDGVMVACRTSAATVQTALSTQLQHLQAVSLAGDNGPQSVTIAGNKEQVDTLLEYLGVAANSKRLQVSHAFHSPLMAGAVSEMEALASTIKFQPATAAIASTVFGRILEESDTPNAHYWATQVTLPVRFREAVEAAVEAAASDRIVFVEVGPQRTLVNLAAQVVSKHEGKKAHWLNLVDKGETADAGLNMEKLKECERACGILPGSGETHKWNHQSFEWRSISHPLFDSDLVAEMDPHMNGKPSLQAPIRAGTLNVLRDHVVWGTPILPGAAFLDAMLAAGLARSKATLADGCAELHDAAILQPMILCEGPEVWGTNNPRCATSHTSVGLTLEVDDSRDRTFVKVSSSHVGGVSAEATLSTATTHAEAFVSFVDESSPRKPQRVDIKAAQEHVLQAKGVQLGCAEVYQELRSRGLEYGPCFQTIRSLLIGENTALVELQFQHKVADFESSFILHPSILDGCFQAAALLALRHMPESAKTLIPTNASDLRVWSTTRSADQRYWAQINLVQETQMTTQGGGAVVSMTLMDDCANVIAEVGTLRLGHVTEDQVFPPERDLGRGMLWTLGWRELKAEPSAPQLAVAEGANSQLAWCLYGVPKDLACSLSHEVHFSENTSVALHFSDSTPHDEATGADSLANFNALIHLGGLYQNDDSAVEYLSDVLGFLQRVAKQLANDTNSTIPPIIVAARRLSAIVPGDNETSPLLAGVRGLCRTAKLEMEAQANRHVPLFLVDLDVAQLNSADSHTDVLDQLAGILRLPALRKAIQNPTKSEQRLIETELAIRSGHTYVPRLKYSGIQLNHSMRRGIELEKGKTFVVTGGLGGLGLVVAEWLAENGAGSVVLLSRTGTPPKEGRTAQLWQALRERHCATDFIIQKCDVGSPNDVENLFAGLKKGVLICHHTCCPYFVKTLSGIFHCAGVLDDRPLLQQDRLALERVFEPKVKGAWNLHYYLEKFNMEKELKHFVMFSSSAGLLGNPGQANYAAANCCLDELAALRRRRHLAAHSIQWGPWVEQGMAAELQGRLAKIGFGGISNALGVLTLGAVMQQDAECVVGCQPVYWERFLGRYKFAAPRTFEEYVQLAASKAKASAATSAVRKTRPRTEAKQRGGKAEHKDQKKQIQHVVMSAAKSVLNDSADVLLDAPLQELGIDSLGAIEFRDAIQAALNVRLSATVLFDHPSIEALTNFLLTEVGDTEPAEAASVIDEAPIMEDVSGFGTAVVGMACRFPGSANDPSSFWKVLSAGIDCISAIPKERFDVDAAYESDADAVGKMYVRQGGFIDCMDLFDNRFFHISDGEAKQMDPRQRVSLEVAFEAAHDAGYALKDLEGMPMDVFVGAMNHEAVFKGDEAITAFTATSNAVAVLANRISYFYSLTGQSVTIDTACSSSLVALCLSLPSIATKQGPALVLGVNALLTPTYFVQTCKAHMLSVDGRCKTFDASANGYVRSEGCGAVILKALPRDTTDSSTVYAWIRGAANNHVGRSASLTAPNGPAQQAVIRAALHNAGVTSPAEVSVLEAHGTGTSLGDPIEVGAIRAVYCNGFPHSPPLILGALKSLMGHAEGAAGIAGLIKLILVLQHRMATPNLHLNTLNPHIDLDKGDRYRDILFPSKCVPLGSLFGMTDSQPLLGAVSSFGFGGSNAHAIVEVPPIFKPTWTINGKQAAADLAEANATVIWLLSGQGSQYLDMACAYFRHSPIFKDTISACTATLKQMSWFPTDGPQSIEDLVYGTEWQPNAQAREEILSSTQYSQVAIFAVELALSKVLMERGLKPDIVLGHSLGEYAAATVAGVMEWEDALRLVAKRASLLAAQPQQDGVMVACRTSAATVQTALSTHLQHLQAVSLAGDNGPQSVTIAGNKEQVDTLLEYLGVAANSKRLQVSHAFHSPLMAGAVSEMKALASSIKFQPASIAIASTVFGRMLTESDTPNAHYWATQVTLPVRFREAVEAAVKAAASDRIVFVEVGPQRTLVNLANQILKTSVSSPPKYLELAGRDTVGESSEDIEKRLELILNSVAARAGVLWNHRYYSINI